MTEVSTPVHVLLRDSARAHPGVVAQRVRVDRSGSVVGAPAPGSSTDAPAGWRETTYADLVGDVDALAAALLRLGVDLDSRVAILCPNRPEWHVVDYAVMTLGAVVVPIHVTSPVEHVRHILDTTDARVVVVESQVQVERLGPLLDGRTVIAVDAPGAGGEAAGEGAGSAGGHGEGEQVLAYADLLDAGREHPAPEEIARRLEVVGSDHLATIIHTSGTTGMPKGVPLTHGNLTPQYHAVIQAFGLQPGDRSLCFLPLSHALERGWSALALAAGCTIAYVHNPREVGAYLPEVRPQVMVSVPRLYERVYATAHERAGQGPRRRVFDWALRTGAAYHARLRAGRWVSPVLRARYAAADRLVLSALRDAMGGPKKCLAAGGAPLRREVEELFASVGLPISQGYGLTESAPLISFNAPGHTRLGTVGRPFPGVEARLGADGELQVRGPGVMSGYLDAPDATSAVLDEDGWLATGDLASIDPEGYITITGRTKDIIITDGGRNIAPVPLESAMEADAAIEYAMVVGDARPYLTALVQPDFAELPGLARGLGVEVPDDLDDTARAALASRPEVVAEIARRAVEATSGFPAYEQVRRVHVLDRPLSMDAGELTPTLKVRRATMTERYADALDALYARA